MFRTEFLDLVPVDGALGTVHLPGSKSISNRVLLLAALSAGTTVVHDLLDSDDTRVMLDALGALGCTLRREGSVLHVTGLGGKGQRALIDEQVLPLFLGNAGTAMRPLTAALALLGGHFEMTGVARMYERPIGDLVDALRQLGCQIDYLQTQGFPPLAIRPPQLHINGPISVRGDVSSQFLTALLLALPLVAQQDIVIEVVGELISKPYVEITLNLLGRFGIQVKRPSGSQSWQRFTIPAGSHYQSPGDIYIEADASSASYFIALGAIAASPRQDGAATPLTIEGLGEQSIQGDIRFVDAARAMGADITTYPNRLEIRKGQWPLRSVTLDCNAIPDAAMTLAVMALYASGTTRLYNIGSWRVKETDRIEAMATELRKLGATVSTGPDFIEVTPPPEASAFQDAVIHTYDDHRIAMCFALASCNPAGRTVRIMDPRCVGKTFPDFFETFFSVAQARVENIPVICVDGPTASGKGTLASQVASRLGYHYLDSGAIYRALGFAAIQAGIALIVDNEPGLADLARHLALRFDGDQVFLSGQDITQAIRTEEAGLNASKVSALPLVRQALVQLQLQFRQLPGLVADGRDMGTVIFPGASLKVFLTATAEKRAERRYKQLISKGNQVILSDLKADLEVRDARDANRASAPLKVAPGSHLLDNSELSIEESVSQVLVWWQDKRPFKGVPDTQ
jgi:3-phosphoshikimate 1-carboxyvinyltransferase